jgi:hypothetical protein
MNKSTRNLAPVQIRSSAFRRGTQGLSFDGMGFQISILSRLIVGAWLDGRPETRMHQSKRIQNVFPLPVGEGQGEGRRTSNKTSIQSRRIANALASGVRSLQRRFSSIATTIIFSPFASLANQALRIPSPRQRSAGRGASELSALKPISTQSRYMAKELAFWSAVGRDVPSRRERINAGNLQNHHQPKNMKPSKPSPRGRGLGKGGLTVRASAQHFFLPS